MAFKVPWQQVYPGISKLPGNEVATLNIQIPKKHYDAIMSVAINPAIFSHICQSRLFEVKDFIESNNLTYGNSDRLLKFISERANHQPAADSNPRNDGSTAQGVRSEVATGPGATPGAGKVVKTKRNGEKGTGG